LPVLFNECEAPPSESNSETTGESEPETSGSEEEFPPIDQSIAQPCVVDEGAIPADGSPCPNQELGAFDGTESFYNSGFIGFETDRENVFTLQVSESIAPGAYPFFCAVHGSFQSGVMEVVPADQPIASPSEVNQRTRQELNQVVEPFRQVFAQAQAGQIVMGGEALSGNFSGLVDDQVQGLLNEFVPETITAQVDEPVTWLMFGPHSISFDVPEYFPIYETASDLGVVVCVHEGARTVLPQAGSDRYSEFGRHIACHPLEQMLACLNLCADGVLEKFPRLKVAHLESGCGWVPFWLERMDEHWEHESHGSAKITKEKPSYYFKRQCWASCEAGEELAPVFVEHVGEDYLVVATDYPHSDAVGKFPDRTIG
ncbi:MAG: amidohydrolase family protein, partial [bacterium]